MTAFDSRSVQERLQVLYKRMDGDLRPYLNGRREDLLL